jgi:hypothetical protein
MLYEIRYVFGYGVRCAIEREDVWDVGERNHESELQG